MFESGSFFSLSYRASALISTLAQSTFCLYFLALTVRYHTALLKDKEERQEDDDDDELSKSSHRKALEHQQEECSK